MSAAFGSLRAVRNPILRQTFLSTSTSTLRQHPVVSSILRKTIVSADPSTSSSRRFAHTTRKLTPLPDFDAPESDRYGYNIWPINVRVQPFTPHLLLIAVPTPSNEWPKVVEKEERMVTAVSNVNFIQTYRTRVLAIYDPTVPAYSARVIRNGKSVDLGVLDEEMIQTMEFRNTVLFAKGVPQEQEILVCTHGSRDCKCGDIGGDLVQALRGEAESAGLNVKITECSHVGGHKWAANAVLLPSMHMLSNLRPKHSSEILQHLSDISNGKNGDMWEHFRGAYELSREKQLEIYDQAVEGMRREEEERDQAVEGMRREEEERETATVSPAKRQQALGVRSYSTSAARRRSSASVLSQSPIHHLYSSRRAYSSRAQGATSEEQEDTRNNDNRNQHGPEEPKAQTISQKLKELFTKYGRYAFVMYWVLSAADFSVAFLGVHLIGADRLLPIKDWVVDQWHKIKPPPEEDKSIMDTATETAEHVAHVVTDAVVTGKQAEEKKAQSDNSLLWAEAALAYTIHKVIFLPVRVGLTAAWTPKFVKWLTARGWVGKGGITRAATHAQGKVKDASDRLKVKAANIRNRADK